MFGIKKLKKRLDTLEQEYINLYDITLDLKRDQHSLDHCVTRLEQRHKQLTCPHREENLEFRELPPNNQSTWRYQKVCSSCGKVLESWMDDRLFYKARAEWYRNRAEDDSIRAGGLK